MENRYRYAAGFQVSEEGNQFRIATLGFVENENEFFYHLAYPRKTREACLMNADKQQLSTGGAVDHISFHKNGLVHMTHKKYCAKVERTRIYELGINVFDIAQYGIFPLLMESFCFDETFQGYLPLFSKQNGQELIFETPIHSVFRFSLVLFICKTPMAAKKRPFLLPA